MSKALSARPAAIASALAMTFVAALASALTLPHSGQVVGAGDAPLTGTHAMRFVLWSDVSAGTALWTGETSPTAACQVSINAGYYSVVLGDTCGSAIPDGIFASATPLWLEVEVDDVKLAPRQRLHIAPVARFFAGPLGGDVTGTQGASVVSSVGGVPAATVAAASGLATGASSTSTPSTLVKRDGSGNFSAGVATLGGLAIAPNAGTGRLLTSDVNGNATWQDPNASALATGTVAVARGGTGASSLATNQLVLGGGTAPLAVVSGTGSAGQVLLSNGPGNAPSWGPPPDMTPVGAGHPFFGDTAPAGYFLAQGQAVSRTTYQALFLVIGTKYGAGDGTTTFNLPDLRGRVPVGLNGGTFTPLGKSGGEEMHQLSAGEMPSHNHIPSGAFESLYVFDTASPYNFTGGAAGGGIHYGGKYAPNAGGDQAHNNLQPYLTTNWIIRY